MQAASHGHDKRQATSNKGQAKRTEKAGASRAGRPKRLALVRCRIRHTRCLINVQHSTDSCHWLLCTLTAQCIICTAAVTREDNAPHTHAHGNWHSNAGCGCSCLIVVRRDHHRPDGPFLADDCFPAAKPRGVKHSCMQSQSAPACTRDFDKRSASVCPVYFSQAAAVVSQRNDCTRLRVKFRSAA